MSLAAIFIPLRDRAALIFDGWFDTLDEVIEAWTPQRGSPQVLALRGEDVLTLWQQTNDGFQKIGTWMPGNAPEPLKASLDKIVAAPAAIILRLAPDAVIRRRIALPSMARNVLEPVLANQIERISPWPVNQVVYDYEVGDTSSKADTIEINLTMIGYPQLDRYIEELKPFGLTPAVVDCGPSPQEGGGINLLPASRRLGKSRKTYLRRALLGIAGLTVLVGVIGLVQLNQRYSAYRKIKHRVAAILPAATRSGNLDRHNRDEETRVAMIIDKRKATTASVLILDALSKALPDDAWLTQLDIRANELKIMGKAKNPPDLIPLLEATPPFRRVRFAAPTIRSPDSPLELFTIAADVGPLPPQRLQEGAAK